MFGMDVVLGAIRPAESDLVADEFNVMWCGHWEKRELSDTKKGRQSGVPFEGFVGGDPINESRVRPLTAHWQSG